MVTVTIGLRIGRTFGGERVRPAPDAVDLDRLSPRARALAEAVHASLGHKAAAVLIECDRPRGDGYRSEQERAAFGDPDRDDKPVRQEWSAWDRFYADAPETGEWYLERQAAKIPAGWHVFGPCSPSEGAVQVPTTERELTSEQVVATIARYSPGTRMTARSWRSLVWRGRAPGPTRHVGRTPLWDPAEVLEWLRARPGQGARTDLATDPPARKGGPIKKEAAMTTPTTITLVSANPGDIVAGRELAECGDLATRLPADAQAWMDEQGYGSDEDELVYVLAGGEDIPTGYPVYRVEMTPAPEDITVTLTRPADWATSDWDWAEAATEAWLAAARAAGLVVEVDDVNREAAIVETRDAMYVLEVRSDEVRAVLTRPSGPRCTHEGRHDYQDGRCTLAPAT